MKKFQILLIAAILTAVIGGFALSFLPARAAERAAEEDKAFHVYYQEAIGAGNKVYHVTMCKKAPAMAPLRCVKKDDTMPYFQGWGQCVDDEGKPKDGTIVMGCIEEGAYFDSLGVRTEKPDESTSYFYADPEEYKRGECKDEPERQGPYYVPQMAVVSNNCNVNTGENCASRGTVTWSVETQASDSQLGEYINNNFGGSGANLTGLPVNRSTLCVTYDVVKAQENNTLAKEINLTSNELSNRLKNLFDSGPGSNMTDADCNTDNSKGPVAGLHQSTPFNNVDTYSCSILERITGTSGTDIFSNYVGALYRWAASLVGIIAVLVMVISGIQISMAGGDSAKLDSAKNRILQSIIGLVLLFLSGLILYTINPTFFTGG